MNDLAKLALETGTAINAVGQPEAEPFIGIREAMDLLGYSKNWIHSLCKRGELPHYQRAPGADLKFKASELLAWLERGGKR